MSRERRIPEQEERDSGRLQRWARRPAVGRFILSALSLLWLCACSPEREAEVPRLTWYVFAEPSGAFAEAARACSAASAAAGSAYRIELIPLPADADQQREQLVRRLAAGDSDIDIIGMDVIWTAEFAAAGWIRPWPAAKAEEVSAGRLASAVAGATYGGRLQAAPFTTNTQLLWYRKDRVDAPPRTWGEMLEIAESLGGRGTIAVQGERYEGLTVFFNSLLASAGGTILEDGRPALEPGPTRTVLQLMRAIATSPAAPASLATAREDQSRLAFESGDASFMVNYTYVWPSARKNAPEVAANMGWARWPAVRPGRPSRVTLGGINLGIGAYGDHPDLAFAAAACLCSEENQRLAARQGGLPPTIGALYHDEEVRRTFPFADTLVETLEDAVQRPRTPLYHDLSLAVSHTLHPLREIDPERDLEELREQVSRALDSEGLL